MNETGMPETAEGMKFATVDTLLKPTTIFCAYDAEARVAYATNVEDLAKAVAARLAADGVIPAEGD